MREPTEQACCPACDGPTRRANSLHRYQPLLCESCEPLVARGAERILAAAQMVARGSSFWHDCARSAARDIVRDALSASPGGEDEPDTRNDLRICPDCHVVAEFRHHPDDVPERCDCGSAWYVWRLVRVSAPPEPDTEDDRG